MNPLVLVVIGAIVLVLVIVALSAIRVVQQYARLFAWCNSMSAVSSSCWGA